MVGSDARRRWKRYFDPSIKGFHVCNETKIGRSGITEFFEASIKDLNVRSIFVIRIVSSSVAECLWHLVDNYLIELKIDEKVVIETIGKNFIYNKNSSLLWIFSMD